MLGNRTNGCQKPDREKAYAARGYDAAHKARNPTVKRRAPGYEPQKGTPEVGGVLNSGCYTE